METPLVPNEKIEASAEGEVRVNVTHYRELIGMLNHIATHTRPDIALSLSKLSQFQTDPCIKHLNLVHHVIRYLHNTIHYKMWLNGSNGSNGLNVRVFADASYAPDASCEKNPDSEKEKVNFRSVTEVVSMVGDAVVGWSSKKQSIAVSSSFLA